MQLKKVCQAIKEYKSFLITAHYEPEGDAIGSQLAMAEILKQLGKRCVIVNPDLPPPAYSFLKGVDSITQPSGAVYDFDAVLVLDCPCIGRIGAVGKMLGKKPIINIDHHISNDRFGMFNYVRPDASSTGEIVCEIAVAFGSKITKDMAACLYLAILTDTGGFRYSNTTANAMRAAASLLDCGVSPKQIYERIYESHSLASRRLLGLGLSTLEVSKDGKIAWMRLTKEMFKKTNAKLHDSENFVNYARFIEGVRAAALFNNNAKDGFVRVSFRSNDKMTNVNNVAKKFGGGGHVSASGCFIKGGIAAVEKKVLRQLRRALG